MKRSSPAKTNALARLPPGVFTLEDAAGIGLGRYLIYRLVDAGDVIQLERGVFQNPKSAISPEDIQLAAACTYFGPESWIGGLTALFRYGLIEQVPTKIWILVPPHVKRAGPIYRIIHTKLDPRIAVTRHCYYRIANVDRAIVEALRYATKIGLSTAIRAAREAIKSGQTSDAKISKTARDLGLQRFVLRHWDAIIVE